MVFAVILFAGMATTPGWAKIHSEEVSASVEPPGTIAVYETDFAAPMTLAPGTALPCHASNIATYVGASGIPAGKAVFRTHDYDPAIYSDSGSDENYENAIYRGSGIYMPSLLC